MLVTKIRDSRELEDCLEGTWRPFEEWGGGGGGRPRRQRPQAKHFAHSLTRSAQLAASSTKQAPTRQALGVGD